MVTRIFQRVRSLLGFSRPSPRPHETYPIHFIDQTPILRDSIITYTFRYNCILEPAKLHYALTRLQKAEDWRKLSGRLRRNDDGKLAIHVYDNVKDHSLFRFSHASYDVPVREHPLGSRLPHSTGSRPSIQEGWDTFKSFSLPPDLPADIRHYLSSDEPLLSLRVVSFTDTTLVSVTIPHALTDAKGTVGFLQAWSAMLNERPDQMPPVLGTKNDVAASIGSSDDVKAQGPHVLEQWRLRGLSLVVMVLRLAWDRFTRRNVHVRTIYLPAAFVSDLRQAAYAEYYKEDGNETKTPFLSDGDLIIAWVSHMILSSQAKKGSPAVIHNIFDARGRIKGPFSTPGVHLQNLILPAVAIVPAAPDGETPWSVGQIACRIRQAILEQTTDEQARRLIRVFRESFSSTKMMPFFGTANSTVIACTNWSKAGFREAAHFGPAAQPSDGSSGPPGACVSYAGSSLTNKYIPRDILLIYGKDDSGNYLINGYLRDETWELIRKVFDSYQPGASEES